MGKEKKEAEDDKGLIAQYVSQLRELKKQIIADKEKLAHSLRAEAEDADSD